MLIDNKKTREISWNNFELEGNKENLINQGWESFEPYGFGEFIGKAPLEVFQEGYLRNFLPIQNNWEVGSLASVDGSEIDLNTRLRTKEFYYYLPKKFFYVYCPNHHIIIMQWDVNGNYLGTSGWQKNAKIELEDDAYKYRVVLRKDDNSVTDLEDLIGAEIGIYFDNITDKNFRAWEDFSDEEKSVNAYEKGYTYIQPLDNGFTRVRTKGGDTDMKYKSPNFGQLAETGTDMTISLYVENNSDSMIRFSNNLAIGGVPYPDGAEYMIAVPREYKGFAYLKGEQVGRDVELDIRSDGNIDMIVSQPEIIEGHDLNAMLLIEDLDDGRKHVQVHNVNEDTKLVYTGGGVIKGEPYTLETEIENDGRIFNLSANMFDNAVEVQKGMNDIRKSGELQDKELKIEIGVD